MMTLSGNKLDCGRSILKAVLFALGGLVVLIALLTLMFLIFRSDIRRRLQTQLSGNDRDTNYLTAYTKDTNEDSNISFSRMP